MDKARNTVELDIIPEAVARNRKWWLLPEKEYLVKLRSLKDKDKKNITHHLVVHASGPAAQVDILGSLVNDTSKLIGETQVKRTLYPEWDKKPYADSRSDQGGQSFIPMHVASADDLRKLLQAAKDQGVNFAPGHERTAIDQATRIIQAVGLGR